MTYLDVSSIAEQCRKLKKFVIRDDSDGGINKELKSNYPKLNMQNRLHTIKYKFIQNATKQCKNTRANTILL